MLRSFAGTRAQCNNEPNINAITPTAASNVACLAVSGIQPTIAALARSPLERLAILILSGRGIRPRHNGHRAID
jgi:hypothetical protein